MVKKKKGIILNSIDYKENHKILYVLTQEGKESFLVMRAKRIKEGLLTYTQNLTAIEFELDDKNSLPKAKNIEVLNDYNLIKNDLKKYTVASYALELIYRMVEASEHYDVLFNLLEEFLNKLSQRNDERTLLLEFRIKMLYFLGVQPQFKVCCHCGSSNDLFGLSIKHGSMECVYHKSSDNIGETTTKIFNLLYYDKTLDITIDDNNVIDIVSDIIDSYYEKHQFYGLKSVIMLKKLGCY